MALKVKVIDEKYFIDMLSDVAPENELKELWPCMIGRPYPVVDVMIDLLRKDYYTYRFKFMYEYD